MVRFLHLLNLDGFSKTIHLAEHGQPLLDGRALTLERRAGIMLPLHVRCGDVNILYSTAEIAAIEPAAIRFRLTQPQDVIAIETTRQISPSPAYRVEQQGTTTLIVSNQPACLEDRLTISF